MDSQTLITGAITVGVGALSGGITNAVAIWMLFNPHDERKVGPFTWHGALPKNKPRLAKAIGRTVGEKLLTPEDLATRLGAPAVRDAFTRALDGALTRFLTDERGPVLDLLGPAVRARLETALVEVARRGADRVAEHAGTPAFEGQVRDLLTRFATDLADRPIGEVLTDERRAALHGAVQRWLAQLTEGTEFRAAAERWVSGQLERLSAETRPLAEQLPAGLLGVIESAVNDYLPLAVERLGALLADPNAKGEVKRALREAFDRSVREMLVHERLLAKLLVTDKAIGRFVDGLEGDGFDRLAAAVNAPEMRARIGAAVADSAHAFLRVPLGERLQRLGPERRAALAHSAAEWLVLLARDPGTRTVAASALDRALLEVDRRTWGELLRALPAEEVARVARGIVQGEKGHARVAEAIRALALALLTRPLGRPADWLGDANVAALKSAIIDGAWHWVQEQVPTLVTQLDIPGTVEQKVLGFSTERMEQLVRDVSQRELTLIVNLGYVLGALVGLLTWGVTLVAR